MRDYTPEEKQMLADIQEIKRLCILLKDDPMFADEWMKDKK
jgi:hypothetical protein